MWSADFDWILEVVRPGEDGHGSDKQTLLGQLPAGRSKIEMDLNASSLRDVELVQGLAVLEIKTVETH